MYLILILLISCFNKENKTDNTRSGSKTKKEKTKTTTGSSTSRNASIPKSEAIQPKVANLQDEATRPEVSKPQNSSTQPTEVSNSTEETTQPETPAEPEEKGLVDQVVNQPEVFGVEALQQEGHILFSENNNPYSISPAETVVIGDSIDPNVVRTITITNSDNSKDQTQVDQVNK